MSEKEMVEIMQTLFPATMQWFAQYIAQSSPATNALVSQRSIFPSTIGSQNSVETQSNLIV